MSRTIKQVDAYINRIFYQYLTKDILDKINIKQSMEKTSGVFSTIWESYIHDHSDGLILKKHRANASFKGVKTAFSSKKNYVSSDFINFFKSIYGDRLIKKYLLTIFNHDSRSAPSMFANKIYLNHKDNLKYQIIDNLQSFHDIKFKLQKTYNKYYHYEIKTKKSYAKVSNVDIDNAYEKSRKKSDETIKILTEEIVEIEQRQLSIVYGLEDLHNRYYSSTSYHDQIHVPAIKKYRAILNKLENQMLSKINDLIDTIESSIFEYKATAYLKIYHDKIINNHISHSDSITFIREFDLKHISKLINEKLQQDLMQALNYIYLKYRVNYHKVERNFRANITSRYLKKIFSENISSEGLSFASVQSHDISSRLSNVQDIALELKYTYKDRDSKAKGMLVTPKRYMPSSSRFIDAIPAGTLVTIGALSNDLIESVGANGHHIIFSVRDMSGGIEQIAEIKSSVMEKTNTLLDLTGRAKHGFSINDGFIVGVGMVAVTAKLANSSLALINAIECRVKLSVKQDLILNAIAITFDDKVWQCLELMQQTAYNIGLIKERELNGLQNLYYGSITYDPKKGFAKILRDIINYTKDNIELMLHKASMGKLSLIELIVLYGLLLDKQDSLVSAYECNMLQLSINNCNKKINKLIGMESLPDGDVYKEYLKTNMIAVDSLAKAIFNFVRLENISESSNKDIAFAVSKSAIHACTLAVSSAAISGVGGLSIAMLPATLDGIDKLSDVIYAHINPLREKYSAQAQAIHASDINDELSEEVSKIQTLYNIYSLKHEDFPDKILKIRSEIKSKLNKTCQHSSDIELDRDIILKNTLAIKQIKLRIEDLEHEILNTSCKEQKKCIMHVITCCKQKLDVLLSENSKVVHKNLDHEKLAIGYFDQAVYRMLINPVIDQFNKNIKLVNIKGDRFATKGDKIALQQTIAKMTYYLENVDIVNIYEISRDLNLIAHHDGFGKIFKPIISGAKLELLESKLKDKIEAHILFYRAHTCNNSHEAKSLLSRCNMDIICSTDNHKADIFCENPVVAPALVARHR